MNTNHKSDFRKLCIERLKFVSQFSKYNKSKFVVKNLKKFILENDFKNILLYIPLGIEVDIKPLIKDLRRLKKCIYVPYMYEDSFKIVKYRLPLKKKKFGILEPNNSFVKPKRVDLAVVPIVGVDKVRECMIDFLIDLNIDLW